MKKTKKIFFILFMVCLLLTATTAIVAEAAYFARGKFKDVFVNKQEYFSADILYSLSSIDSEKEKVGSPATEQNISVYNHDVHTGDFNAFDVTFDVYVWSESDLPEGKAYVFSYYENGVAKKIAISTTDHASPIASRTLIGGKSSTETFTVSFGYEEGEDLNGVPGLNVVVVPTYPERLSSVILGSTITPTGAESFSVSGSFDTSGKVEDYAAFTYQVRASGPVSSDVKIVLRWNANALTLMTQNKGFPSPAEEIQEGIYNRKIEWKAKNNDTDVFVFFRNTKNEMWNGEVYWSAIAGQVSVEYVEEAQE